MGLRDRLLTIDIYDGAGVHHINTTCNTLEYSAVNAGVSKKLDDLQPDGETSSHLRLPPLVCYILINTMKKKQEKSGGLLRNR